MPPPTPAVRTARAKKAGLTLGVLTGKRQPDDPELKAAKADLAAANIASYIERVLATAPPLSEDQKAALVTLLAPARKFLRDEAVRADDA